MGMLGERGAETEPQFPAAQSWLEMMSNFHSLKGYGDLASREKGKGKIQGPGT